MDVDGKTTAGRLGPRRKNKAKVQRNGDFGGSRASTLKARACTFCYPAIKCGRTNESRGPDFSRIKSSATNNSDGVAVNSLKSYTEKRGEKRQQPLFL